MPLWALVLSSYAIDIVFVGFALAGKEHMPARSSKARPAAEIAVVGAADADEATTGALSPGTNPWSHGLAMAAVWTLLSMVISAGVSRDRHTTSVVGRLVIGHWLVDFITKPMTALFPEDTGLPLLFEGSPTVGLGLYRSRRAANAVEYGSLAVGTALYLQTIRDNQRS
jgi:hypothetical protein